MKEQLALFPFKQNDMIQLGSGRVVIFRRWEGNRMIAIDAKLNKDGGWNLFLVSIVVDVLIEEGFTVL